MVTETTEQMDMNVSEVALSEEAQRLYLNYALSVITSRALPDVRDGLKPVQRRILFAMHHELRLTPEGKPAKSARIVGDVIGKYHPHGDTAIYDALVRMAQDWVMRAQLVVGQGNFGSIDGDSPAAYRYTEAKLSKIATELLLELPKKTVEYRQTFDATRWEPVVLPARIPNMLVNGAQGIAVGMATSIPPHNLGEVCDGLIEMLADKDITNAKLMRKIRGPDFPTGGEVITPKAQLKTIYETGQGSIKVRGTWKREPRKDNQIIITAVPYGVEKNALEQKIAEVINSKKLPGLVDVRDESTDIVRLVLETKPKTNPELIMAYLAKHTTFQTNVQFNLTCLVPKPKQKGDEGETVCAPERLDLRSVLRHFLDFRFEVVTKRLEHERDQLKDRLHILEGFEKVFDALDEIIKIIRRSEGKADAAKKIMKRFALDERQTDAILELKLYRLAKLEILVITEEANKKRKELKRIETLLKSPKRRWTLIGEEIQEIKKAYHDKRRTKILGSDDTAEFSAEDFIIEEDAIVIVTEMGWLKRQGSVKDLSTTRVKKGDRVFACVGGSTRATVAFFTNQGTCYVMRIADIVATTGHGNPIHQSFKLSDGEKIVGVMSFDPRMTELPEEEMVHEDGSPAPPYGLAITRKGMALRFPLFGHKEPSTRSGRRFIRVKPEDEVLTVIPTLDMKFAVCAASDGHAHAVKLDDLALLAGVGQGSMLIKLDDKAHLVGAVVVPNKTTGCLAVRTAGKQKREIFAGAVLGSRGGKGKLLVKRSGFAKVEYELPDIPELSE